MAKLGGEFFGNLVEWNRIIVTGDGCSDTLSGRHGFEIREDTYAVCRDCGVMWEVCNMCLLMGESAEGAIHPPTSPHFRRLTDESLIEP